MAIKLSKPLTINTDNTESTAASEPPGFARRLDVWPVWLAAFLLIYGLSAGPFLWEGTVFNYHSWQAHAWLQQHLWLPNVTAEKLDLTPFAGQWYSAFPPFPALVMLPLTLIWGIQANQVIVSVALGAFNIVLMRLVLQRLASFQPLNRAAQVWLTLLFGLGTVVWQSVIQGTVWHLAHACAMTLLLTALLIGLDGTHLLAVGGLVGLAGLARPTTWLTLLFWLTVVYRRRLKDGYIEKPGRPRRLLQQAGLLLAGPALALAATLGYNWLRFGALTDFGYTRMLVGQNIRSDLIEYGQFNLHFFGRNFYQTFLSLPQFHLSPPYMVFSLNGNSLLFISPAFLLAGLAVKLPEAAWWSRTFVLGASLAVGATLGLLLLYFNTGQIQFGYRFSQDCLPYIILLAASGWPVGRKGWAVALVVISIFINFYGMMWYQGWWPQLFGTVNK